MNEDQDFLNDIDSVDTEVQIETRSALENTENKHPFDGEVFLSTDGKHTVHVKANTVDSRKAALEWATKAYEQILSKYGAKPLPNYGNKASAPAKVGPMCAIHKKPMSWKEGVSKAGKSYAFWGCDDKLDDGSFCPYKPPKN